MMMMKECAQSDVHGPDLPRIARITPTPHRRRKRRVALTRSQSAATVSTIRPHAVDSGAAGHDVMDAVADEDPIVALVAVDRVARVVAPRAAKAGRCPGRPTACLPRARHGSRRSPSPPLIVSSPRPPRTRSNPASGVDGVVAARPPQMRSSPSPPTTVSLPAPASMTSGPAPPSMPSSPRPARTRSPPSPRSMTSSPASANTRSGPPSRRSCRPRGCRRYGRGRRCR